MGTEEGLAETVAQVEALDRRIHAGVADVRDPDGLAAVLDAGGAELGRLDVVAANASICTVQRAEEVTPEVRHHPRGRVPVEPVRNVAVSAGGRGWAGDRRVSPAGAGRSVCTVHMRDYNVSSRASRSAGPGSTGIDPGAGR